jgi:hypothetical protein
LAYKPFFAAAGLALCMMTAPITVTAQDAAPLDIEAVTDAQIEAFVRAAIALESLRREYADKIGNAATEEAQNELRAEADSVAIQLVNKAKGITADEYLALSKAAQDNEELTTRIAAQVEVMRAKKAEFDKKQADAAKAREAQKAAEAQAAADATKAETAKESSTTE